MWVTLGDQNGHELSSRTVSGDFLQSIDTSKKVGPRPSLMGWCWKCGSNNQGLLSNQTGFLAQMLRPVEPGANLAARRRRYKLSPAISLKTKKRCTLWWLCGRIGLICVSSILTDISIVSDRREFSSVLIFNNPCSGWFLTSLEYKKTFKIL